MSSEQTTMADRLHTRRPLTDPPVLDAHAHGGPYHNFFIPDPDGEAMVRVMDRCGVSVALVSGMLAVELDAAAGNAETAALCRRFPGRFLGYAVVNPWQDPEEQVAAWAEDPSFVGIKLHPDLHEYQLDGPRYRSVWEFAEATGRPVLTHTWAGSAFDDLDHLDRVAERHPQARILAGHAGVDPSALDRAIALAGRHPGVLLELCGSHQHGRAITEMVRQLGADRVVFGSDFPFIDLRMSLGRVLFADLTAAERAAVLGGTMAGLLDACRPGGFRLDPAPVGQTGQRD